MAVIPERDSTHCLVADRLRRREADNAKLKIRAVLIDKDLNQKPVPRLAFVLVPFEGPAGRLVTGRTSFDGTVEVQVVPGKYRLSTPDPVEFQGRMYSWDLDVFVFPLESSVDLSNDNAKVAQATPARKIDELTALFQKYQNAVVTVWSEIGRHVLDQGCRL